ncbi:MAG: nitroreductase [Thermoplasmata archaeon]|nr:MAG: nitroreductase [Thermoplasmata archaeon]
MQVYEAIIKRRSIRRYKQKPIPLEILRKLVNAARLAPSAANLQPFKYIVVYDKNLCDKIFKTIKWASYLKPSWSPEKEERPTAYIVFLNTQKDNPYYMRDMGLAAENIMLTAEEEGIGSCILYNIDREAIRDILNIPGEYQIDSMISLGYKGEEVILEEDSNRVEYWRDENDVLHVPKKPLEEILIINRFPYQ